MDIKVLSQKIVELVDKSEKRLTYLDILKEFKNKAPQNLVKKAVKTLIKEEELGYTNINGHSYIQKNMQQVLAVGEKTQLLFSGVRALENRLAIRLLTGSSFGNGEHPTTRLCLEEIEKSIKKGGRVLDVGTGTGVLAIAAILHGMASALAVDIDPIALYEAGENIKLNKLEDKIALDEKWEEDGSWDLVLANLRPPTLMQLREKLIKSLAPGAFLLLSGIRVDEAENIKKHYKELEFIKIREEKAWALLKFQNKD